MKEPPFSRFPYVTIGTLKGTCLNPHYNPSHEST